MLLLVHTFFIQYQVKTIHWIVTLNSLRQPRLVRHLNIVDLGSYLCNYLWDGWYKSWEQRISGNAQCFQVQSGEQCHNSFKRSEEHKMKRLVFCELYKDFTEVDWAQIMFTDES
ncbi:Hypothetical_protein [Hexamita inflata]|uniref:Hypothetical_protein n=1 Tax=Hexamita inflata TaxID=28002 RepID=A0AA86PWY5_9EUKA|nr:Hypothetical protein HINF_LOCUS33327 [Hexamita inflata]